MAVFSKRVILFLLAVCILISFALRYPLVEHERYQTDSYFIHQLSQTIVDDGRAAWLIHPLSYFGYFPFSYPSGAPFVLAELSEMSGITMEASVLVFNMVIGAIFCLAVFVLAREFVSRPEVALLATLMAVLGARFVDTSYWDGSARAPLVALMTLLVFIIFRAFSSRRGELLLIGGVVAFGCFSTHHMAVLVVMFGFAYVILVVYMQFLIKRIPSRARRWTAAYFIAAAVGTGAVSWGLFDVLSSQIVRSFQETSIFSSEFTLVSVPVNMAIVYTNQIGLVLVFAAVGIPYLFKERSALIKTFFPLAVLIAFIPLLGNPLYISMLIAPYAAILGARFASTLSTRMRSRAAAILLVALVATSVVVPVWSTQRWNGLEFKSGDTVIVDYQAFNDANYYDYAGADRYAISNVKPLELRTAALSEVRFLSSGVPVLINEDLSGTDVREGISWSSDSFPKNIYRWFTYSEPFNVDQSVRGLMLYGVGYLDWPVAPPEAVDYFDTHRTLVVIIDNDWPTSVVSMYSVQPAILPSQLSAAMWQPDGGTESREPLDSYKFYVSAESTSYLVRLPS